MGTDMKSTRAYTMRVRADRVQQTRERILDAVVSLAGDRPLARCTLPAIAERAGVSVQTVLRAYGTRDDLFAAARERATAHVLAERRIDPDDVPATVAALVDHYEARGDGVLLLVGQERWEPLAAEITAGGRRLHREWVARTFAHTLGRLPVDRRERAVDLLVAATDLSVWKLWRRDAGRTRDETLERMLALVASVTRQLDPDTAH